MEMILSDRELLFKIFKLLSCFEDHYTLLSFSLTSKSLSLLSEEVPFIHHTYTQPFNSNTKKIKITGVRNYIQYINFTSTNSLSENLAEACVIGNYQLVVQLLSQGATANENNDKPIKNAAKYCHTQIVEYLINEGADVSVDDSAPLRLSLEYGKNEKSVLETVKTLTKSSNQIKIYDNLPLRIAASKGWHNLVEYLINEGADVSVCEEEPLRKAVEKNYYKTVQILLSNGANLHIWDEYPLQKAMEKKHFRIVKLLIQFGANINAYISEIALL